MPTAPGEGDLKPVGGGHRWPGSHSQPAKRLIVPQMQRQGVIRARILQHAIRQHGLGAAQPLFGWLKDKLDRAPQLFSMRLQYARHGKTDRRVPIMSTSMHHARILGGILGGSLLKDRQGVHIKAR